MDFNVLCEGCRGAVIPYDRENDGHQLCADCIVAGRSIEASDALRESHHQDAVNAAIFTRILVASVLMTVGGLLIAFSEVPPVIVFIVSGFLMLVALSRTESLIAKAMVEYDKEMLESKWGD